MSRNIQNKFQWRCKQRLSGLSYFFAILHIGWLDLLRFKINKKRKVQILVSLNASILFTHVSYGEKTAVRTSFCIFNKRPFALKTFCKLVLMNKHPHYKYSMLLLVSSLQDSSYNKRFLSAIKILLNWFQKFEVMAKSCFVLLNGLAWLPVWWLCCACWWR